MFGDCEFCGRKEVDGYAVPQKLNRFDGPTFACPACARRLFLEYAQSRKETPQMSAKRIEEMVQAAAKARQGLQQVEKVLR